MTPTLVRVSQWSFRNGRFAMVLGPGSLSGMHAGKSWWQSRHFFDAQRPIRNARNWHDPASNKGKYQAVADFGRPAKAMQKHVNYWRLQRTHAKLGMLLPDVPVSLTLQMRSDLDFTIHRSFAWRSGSACFR